MKSIKITTPVAGIITDIKVKEGQSVVAGDVVAILEIMKMENEILAETNGTVSKVNVDEKSLVNADEIIMEINPND